MIDESLMDSMLELKITSIELFVAASIILSLFLGFIRANLSFRYDSMTSLLSIKSIADSTAESPPPTTTIFLPVILFSVLLRAQDPNIHFEHITTKDGLSSNRVNAILKDSKGFMWFGTQDGLNRYDGYNFKIFRNNSKDPKTLTENFIFSFISRLQS